MIRAPRATAAAASLAVLLFRIVASTTKTPVDYYNPVRSADEDKVEYAANTSVNFYAGYLRAYVDDESVHYYHYWFIESESRPDHDPLVLWLNGGPGASSLLQSAEATGPMKFTNGRAVPVNKEYSWTKLANMLYIEGPAGVGFSYALGNPELNDDTTSAANYLALRSFMQKFPKFAKNPLYLTGNSYAGVYVPTLGALVNEDEQLNLKGILIENGLLDSNLDFSSRFLIAYDNNLLNDEYVQRTEDSCCNGQSISREACGFYPGLRLSSDCFSVLNETRIGFSRSVEKTIREARSDLYGRQMIQSRDEMCVFPQPTLGLWDSTDMIGRERIHVPAELSETREIRYCLQYARRAGGMTEQMRALVESPRRLTVLVINGDMDMICNWLGNKWFMDGLNGGRNSGHFPLLFVPWFHNKQLAGFVQHYEGFTYATVRGCGHAPTKEKPELGFSIFRNFLASDGARNVIGFNKLK